MEENAGILTENLVGCQTGERGSSRPFSCVCPTEINRTDPDQRTHSAHSQNCELTNYCCFRALSFEMVYYTAKLNDVCLELFLFNYQWYLVFFSWTLFNY